ncbi:MAG: hypothetical protein R3E31_21920 [Chloroflexota bacterium]
MSPGRRAALAIELATSSDAPISVQTVAASLTDGFDALTTSLRDIPERHRGLHIVFEMSWRTLTTTATNAGTIGAVSGRVHGNNRKQIAATDNTSPHCARNHY